MNNKPELRFYPSNIELREESGKPATVRGLASVFGSPSEDLGGFIEFIERGAFEPARLEDDVRALFNHTPNMVLGRTRSKTLRLWVEDSGLGYEFDLPDTSYANDLRVLLRRKDITQSSFAFDVARDGGQRWVEEDGKLKRHIRKVSRLYDVSPVTFPAYPDTEVALRSMPQRGIDIPHFSRNHIKLKQQLAELG